MAGRGRRVLGRRQNVHQEGRRGSSYCEARSLCEREPVRGYAGLVLRPFRCNLPLSAYLLLDPGSNRAESDYSHRKTPYRRVQPYDPRSMGAAEWSRAPGGAGAGALCDRSASSVAGSAEPGLVEG